MMNNSFEAIGLHGIRAERAYQLASAAGTPSNRVPMGITARRARRAANHTVHPSPSSLV